MLFSKRLWAALLVGLLVVGLLVGFGDGDRAVAKEPRATLGKIMIPAAAFIPVSSTTDYEKNGSGLSVPSGKEYFDAPLWFPVPEVTIRRITILAYDNYPAQQVCVALRRALPLKATDEWKAEACTFDTSANPQKESAAPGGTVNTINQAAYLRATLLGGGVWLYGVQVVYSY